MRRSPLPSLLVLSLATAACGSDGGPAGPSADALQGVSAAGQDGGAGSTTADASAGGAGTDGGSPSTGAGGAAGLPCEVSALLGTYCVSCHGATPIPGVPVSLVSYADLSAPFPGNKSISTAESARQSLESGRMPPTGAKPSSSEIAAFAAWVDTGAPETSCSTGGVVDPFATPSVCSSGSYWKDGEGPKMRPGDTCVSCHAREEDAPKFNVGGTVYPTGHEPNLCDGVRGVTVELTDANGAVHTYETNSAGNFSNFEEAQVAMPYTAKLVASNGRTRSMLTPQTSGDCNSCHTEAGTQGAPGRILMPL
jgi:cytochrome c553